MGVVLRSHSITAEAVAPLQSATYFQVQCMHVFLTGPAELVLPVNMFSNFLTLYFIKQWPSIEGVYNGAT